jgi:prepilin-type processing-associated H-X9-DG protein
LLPAIQAAREAARNMECKNHLKQVGLAANTHLSATGRYPTGGWGYIWIGDPDRGTGRSQPGGWIYNSLPYLDLSSIHKLQKGLTGAVRKTVAAKMLQMPIGLFNCPTRRPSQVYPVVGGNVSSYYFSDAVKAVARSDYAANSGSVYTDPSRVEAPAPSGTIWTNIPAYGPDIGTERTTQVQQGWETISMHNNGIMFPGSQIKPNQINDGASHTFLAGEKYLNPEYYASGWDLGDNECMYIGDNGDIARWTYLPLLRDRRGYTDWHPFGSAHAATCNFVFCDGSVQSIAYTINPTAFEYLGSRNDRKTATY